jgi:RNA polymerase sigma factor (sigma-70 family)
MQAPPRDGTLSSVWVQRGVLGPIGAPRTESTRAAYCPPMIPTRTRRRFRDGEPDAVRAFYDEFSRAVFTVALGALGDRSLAEEAVQTTFLRAWQSAGRYDPELDPGPWLYAIARRVAIDLYRRERRHTASDDQPEMAALPATFEATWEAWEVRMSLDRLTPEERAVIRAIHFLGMSHRQVAEYLSIPIGTVKSRSHRAHDRLAGMLAHLQEASA